MLRRLQFCISVLLEQLERRRLESELILVDWNPPPDRPRLKDAIQWPDGRRYVSVRVVEVPLEVHQRYQHWDIFPVNCPVGWNVGLRRARGTFSIGKVADVLWSEALVSHLSRRTLDPDCQYRCERVDVSPGVLEVDSGDVARVLDSCEQHVTARNPNYDMSEYGIPNLFTNACGDFQLLSTENHQRLRGYCETDSVVSPHCDGTYLYSAFKAGIREVVLPDDLRIYKIVHAEMNDLRQEAALRPTARLLRSVPGLAALARRVLGPLFGGGKVVIRGVEFPPYSDYINTVKKILAGDLPFVCNAESWGLGQETLPHFQVRRAAWEDESCPECC